MRVKFLYILLSVFIFTLVISGTCDRKLPAQNPLSCPERIEALNPEQSEYILPFPVGKSYILSQSYCNPYGGHSNQLAYDFAMSIGDTVCAARAGIVRQMRWDQPDSGEDISASNHNYIMIEHTDGTVAFYAHLKQNSVAVETGDTIIRGQFIALSGNSGNTMGFPHLHFGVYQFWPPTETYDVPIRFRNALGSLNECGILMADSLYSAMEY